MERKPLPVGVDNFEHLLTRGYYFIDKTWFMKELLDKKETAASSTGNRPPLEIEYMFAHNSIYG